MGKWTFYLLQKLLTPIQIHLCILNFNFSCIDFRGAHTNKAQYIRLSFDTKPELVLSLLLREWCLERPKLLITTTGGKANFELQPRIKRSLRRGLLKAAKTTGAWIFTGGTNTGVNRHVGDALMSEKSPRIKGGRVVSIGITPWGIVDRRNELLGKKQEVVFHPVSAPRFVIIITQCFKITKNVSFWHFLSPFVQLAFDMSGNTVWPQDTVFTQNVHNVIKWDFSSDFQTRWKKKQ